MFYKHAFLVALMMRSKVSHQHSDTQTELSYFNSNTPRLCSQWFEKCITNIINVCKYPHYWQDFYNAKLDDIDCFSAFYSTGSK